MKNYGSRVEKARERFEREVQKLADDLRKSVIIPLCKKHKCKYFSGNGTYFFELADGTVVHSWDQDEIEGAPLYIKRALEALGVEVDRQNNLGDYVETVR